jgi:L-seryl-tRNA(Ser) seleniumtransferase
VAVPERYAAALRVGVPAVLARLEAGRCLLDLRALAEESDEALYSAVRGVMG